MSRFRQFEVLKCQKYFSAIQRRQREDKNGFFATLTWLMLLMMLRTFVLIGRTENRRLCWIKITPQTSMKRFI
jgi:hypothetical protein